LDHRGTIKVLSRRRALERNKANDQVNNDESDEEESERKSQLLIEMQRKESEFDVHKYFSTFISNDIIKMYTFLLENYRENSPKVNHYIHSFFHRVKFFKIYKSEEWTMEPILFNIRVLGLFDQMLHDKQIIRRSEYKHLLEFIK
jgi:timeless